MNENLILDESLLRFEEEKPLREAFFIHEWKEYDFSSDNKNAYEDINNKEYLGASYIYRLNGLVQEGVSKEEREKFNLLTPTKNISHFWRFT